MAWSVGGEFRVETMCLAGEHRGHCLTWKSRVALPSQQRSTQATLRQNQFAWPSAFRLLF